MTDGYWIERISEESGTNIVEEYHAMIVNADGLIVLWDGFNRKVKNVIEKAWEYDIELYEFKI